MEYALAHCHKQMGDNATILYCDLPSSIEKMAKEQGKKAGGPWDCYHAFDYFGWEDGRVVAVTGGNYILELITRGRTMLNILLVDYHNKHDNDYYATIKEYFKQAAEQGLVEMK